MINNSCDHSHGSLHVDINFHFCDIFVWFWNQGDANFVERVQKGSFLFNVFWKSLRRIDANSSLNVWQNWPVCMFLIFQRVLTPFEPIDLYLSSIPEKFFASASSDIASILFFLCLGVQDPCILILTMSHGFYFKSRFFRILIESLEHPPGPASTCVGSIL